MLFASQSVMLNLLDMTPDEKQNFLCYGAVYTGYMTETNKLF